VSTQARDHRRMNQERGELEATPGLELEDWPKAGRAPSSGSSCHHARWVGAGEGRPPGGRQITARVPRFRGDQPRSWFAEFPMYCRRQSALQWTCVAQYARIVRHWRVLYSRQTRTQYSRVSRNPVGGVAVHVEAAVPLALFQVPCSVNVNLHVTGSKDFAGLVSRVWIGRWVGGKKRGCDRPHPQAGTRHPSQAEGRRVGHHSRHHSR